MKTPVKLAALIQKLPEPEASKASLALAKLVLADYTRSKQVTTRDDSLIQPDEPDTAIDLLEDKSDAFIALFRSLPENSEVFEHIESLAGSVESIQRALTGFSTALKAELAQENQSEEVEAIKIQTDFESFADKLVQQGEALNDLGTVISTLQSMTAHKVEKEIRPVEHKLPTKQIKIPGVTPGGEESEEENEEG